jgi:hypothetical protein
VADPLKIAIELSFYGVVMAFPFFSGAMPFGSVSQEFCSLTIVGCWPRLIIFELF